MALFIVGCEPVVTAFLGKGTPPHTYAASGLPLFTFGFVFFATNIAIISLYQSIERANMANVIMFMRGIVLVAACFLLLPRLLGTNGLWLAVPASELASMLMIIGIAICGQWKKKSKLQYSTHR
jgi:Na+-driven multidrug efflux pump